MKKLILNKRIYFIKLLFLVICLGCVNLGSAYAELCGTGTYNNEGSCEECPVGYYCSDGVDKYACTGMNYQLSQGKESCEICPAGQYGTDSNNDGGNNKCSSMSSYVLVSPKTCEAEFIKNNRIPVETAGVISEKAINSSQRVHCSNLDKSNITITEACWMAQNSITNENDQTVTTLTCLNSKYSQGGVVPAENHISDIVLELDPYFMGLKAVSNHVDYTYTDCNAGSLDCENSAEDALFVACGKAGYKFEDKCVLKNTDSIPSNGTASCQAFNTSGCKAMLKHNLLKHHSSFMATAIEYSPTASSSFTVPSTCEVAKVNVGSCGFPVYQQETWDDKCERTGVRVCFGDGILDTSSNWCSYCNGPGFLDSKCKSSHKVFSIDSIDPEPEPEPDFYTKLNGALSSAVSEMVYMNNVKQTADGTNYAQSEYVDETGNVNSFFERNISDANENVIMKSFLPSNVFCRPTAKDSLTQEVNTVHPVDIQITKNIDVGALSKGFLTDAIKNCGQTDANEYIIVSNYKNYGNLLKLECVTAKFYNARDINYVSYETGYAPSP